MVLLFLGACNPQVLTSYSDQTLSAAATTSTQPIASLATSLTDNPNDRQPLNERGDLYLVPTQYVLQ